MEAETEASEKPLKSPETTGVRTWIPSSVVGGYYLQVSIQNVSVLEYHSHTGRSNWIVGGEIFGNLTRDSIVFNHAYATGLSNNLENRLSRN